LSKGFLHSRPMFHYPAKRYVNAVPFFRALQLATATAWWIWWRTSPRSATHRSERALVLLCLHRPRGAFNVHIMPGGHSGDSNYALETQTIHTHPPPICTQHSSGSAAAPLLLRRRPAATPGAAGPASCCTTTDGATGGSASLSIPIRPVPRGGGGGDSLADGSPASPATAAVAEAAAALIRLPRLWPPLPESRVESASICACVSWTGVLGRTGSGSAAKAAPCPKVGLRRPVRPEAAAPSLVLA